MYTEGGAYLEAAFPLARYQPSSTNDVFATFHMEGSPVSNQAVNEFLSSNIIPIRSFHSKVIKK